MRIQVQHNEAGVLWRRCELQPFSGEGFAKCLAGRRLLMIGDSTMNGIFSSLACLSRDQLTSGRHRPWELSEMTQIHDDEPYMSRGGETYRQVRSNEAWHECFKWSK